jgi:DNA-binding beta-propeller fold protein YncE
MKNKLRSLAFSSCAILCLALGAAAQLAFANANDNDESILKGLKSIKLVGSTVPAIGDVNPYGMAEVKHSVGKLRSGHILISNFNNAGNLQGTGTTIVDMSPDGTQSVFATLTATGLPGPCPGGIGLTTALVVLSEGWVIVGSLPTSDGTAATAQAGCLIVLDSMGKPVETIFGSLINGPWDMTAAERPEEAALFVTNVLNGTVAANGQVVKQGTVVRIDVKLSGRIPVLESLTVIGSGFAERTDPAALVIGPTGVALSGGCGADHDDDCQLYVADTLNDRITAIGWPLHRTTADGPGATFSAGGSLNAPLGLIVAQGGGQLLTVNGADGFITEINRDGRQIAKTLLDNTGSPAGAGALFGLVFDPARGVYFVDDASNTLNLLH